jgi:hypothetical protein
MPGSSPPARVNASATSPMIFPGARRGERPSVGGGPTRVGGRHLSDGPRGAGAQVGPRTRALLLCNPHSPVGRAWSREELEQLSQSCTARHPRDSRRGLRGAPPPAPCTPFATVSPAASRNTITVTSASKSFNLTGLKHSFVICENPALRWNLACSVTTLEASLARPAEALQQHGLPGAGQVPLSPFLDELGRNSQLSAHSPLFRIRQRLR